MASFAMDGRVDLPRMHLRARVPLLTVVLVLALVMGSCGDGASTGASPPDNAATETPAETLEGHATEDPGGPSEPDTADVERAPELERAGTWYNSEPLSLSELRGKPVLLVFWATY